jgi:KDO2-lipid IV(A) lauroyltransferase
MKYQSKHIFEYVLLRLVAGIIRTLPLRGALSLGWVVAAGAHFIGRVNVERTHTRIREVFGDRYSEKEVRRIAWIAWRNLCFNAIDALRFSMLTPEKIRKQPLASLEPNLKAILKEHEDGFILATPHMGNWEIAGVAADLVGIPLFAIARKQKNPLTDRYINKMRSTFNLEILLSGTKIWASVSERLTTGKVLAILPDINSRAKGTTVDFLNGKATIAPGAARFAQLAQCPIYPVVARRIGWTKHDAVLLDPILPDPTLDKALDQQSMMQELMGALSEEISKTPEQYFWYNKRWVLNAEGRRD